MKTLIIAAAVLFTSCATLRKTKSIERRSVDSASTVEVATVAVKKADSTIYLNKVDTAAKTTQTTSISISTTGYVAVYLDSGDIVTPVGKGNGPGPVVVTARDGKKKLYLPISTEQKQQIKKEAITAKNTSNEEREYHTHDSTAETGKISTVVHTESVIKDKHVERVSYWGWLWIGLGVAVLVLLYRFRKNIF